MCNIRAFGDHILRHIHICKARLSPSNTLYSSLMNFNLFKNSVQLGTSIYLVRYPVPIPTGCKYRYRYKNKIKIPESIIYFFSGAGAD